MKRIIAFDIGDKTVGIAISDPNNTFALPCETLFRKRFFQDIEYLAKFAKDRDVGTIVCGLPLNFDGSESIQTAKTKSFVEELKKHTDIDIVFEDERFTSIQAEDDLIFGGVRRENRKKTIDSIAASYILEGYLNKLKNKKDFLEV